MTTPEIQRRRVLVVDDNEAGQSALPRNAGQCAARDTLHDILTVPVEGAPQLALYELDAIAAGPQAVAKVRAALAADLPYALVFVDMSLPPAWERLETVESIWQADPDILVVLCTAYSDCAWERILARFGQADRLLFLNKPFDRLEVAQLARALSEKWNLLRQERARRRELEQLISQQRRAQRRAAEALRHEVAQRRSAEQRLLHVCAHDPLTKLPNRVCLLERLCQCLQRAARHAVEMLAVLLLDIDNFKVINGGLGHRYGDELLVEAAQRLRGALDELPPAVRPAASMAGRGGGDEFIILLDGIRRAGDAVAVAEHIQRSMSRPFRLCGRDVGISTSIGIALGDSRCDDAAELLRSADTALHRAKHDGKSRHAVFDPSMHVEAMARLELENALRAALDQEQFRLLYQPIVALDTGRIRAFEALLRWTHPQRGVVTPAEFVPLAEELGLIGHLGHWALRQACRQLSCWQRQYAAGGLSISVNVSNRQLLEPGFCAQVEEILGETGVGGRNLNLEITESAIVTAAEPVGRRLLELKQLGVQLHMDDFGTGYSSLSYLHRSPFDVVKIDRAFVTNIAHSREYTAVVHAIVTLDIEVTAEGLETPEQLAQILALDCDHAQGYYFSPPVDAATAAALMTSQAPWLDPNRPPPQPPIRGVPAARSTERLDTASAGAMA